MAKAVFDNQLIVAVGFAEVILYHVPMKIAPDSLPNDVDMLKQLLLETLAAKEIKIAALKQSVQRLLEQFRQAQQQRFGVSCERHDYQGELFNEAEVTLEAPRSTHHRV